MGTTSMCLIKKIWISEICIKIGHISDAVRVKPALERRTTKCMKTQTHIGQRKWHLKCTTIAAMGLAKVNKCAVNNIGSK